MGVRNRRRSYQILNDLCSQVGYENVSYEMHVSKTMVYKWAETPGDDDLFNSGKRNPLDRVRTFIQVAMTEGHQEIAVEIINWLSAELGGVFIADDQINAIEKLVNAVKDQQQPQLKKVK